MCMKNVVIKYSTLRWCDNRRAVHAEMLPFCEYVDCLSCHCCRSANTQHSVTLSEEILTRDRDISYGFSYRSTHISPLFLCSCSTHKQQQQQWSGAVLCWLLLPLDNKTDVWCDVERKKCLETSSAMTTSDSAAAIAVAKTKQISMWGEEKNERKKKSIWLSIEKSSHHKFIWMWKNNTTRIQTILYSAMSSSDEENREESRKKGTFTPY